LGEAVAAAAKIATAVEAEEQEKKTTSWTPEVSKTFGDAEGTAAEIAEEKAKEVFEAMSTTRQAISTVTSTTDAAKSDFSSVAEAAAKAAVAAEEKAKENFEEAKSEAEATHQKLADVVSKALNATVANNTSQEKADDLVLEKKVSGDIEEALKTVSKSWTNDTEASLRKSVEDTKLNILNTSQQLDKLDQASSELLEAQSHAAAAKIVKDKAEYRLADLANQTIAQSSETLATLNTKDGLMGTDKIIASSIAAQKTANEAAELAKQADIAKQIYEEQVAKGEEARHEELSIAVQMSRRLNNIMESSARGIKAVSEEVNATELRGRLLNTTAEAPNQTVSVIDNLAEKAENFTEAANNLVNQLSDAAQKTTEAVNGTVQEAQRVADEFKNQFGMSVGAQPEDSSNVVRKPLAIKSDGFSETPVLAGIAVLVALLLAVICCTTLAK
jgi:hypothetical protein